MNPTVLKIRTVGDPCLREVSTSVEEVTISERMLIEAMLNTMYKEKGIGLAAPQVGINKRIIVADIGEGPNAFINPEILKESGREQMEEGCLSVPEKTVVVERAKRILLKYLDIHNKIREEWLDDFWARVVLHETDHLEGKLIIDYETEKGMDNPDKSLDESHDRKLI